MDSPYLNRFIQPDTIIPGMDNPQRWNRYSYVSNSPVNYSDPSGHGQCRTQEDCADMGLSSPMEEFELSAGGGGGGGGGGGNCNNDPDCELGDGSDDYLIDWFDTTLTSEQTTDLLYEIDWWLDVLEKISSGLNYLPFAEIAGIATLVGLVFAPAAALTAVAAVTAISAWALENMIENTINDLQDLRYAIAVNSDAQMNPETGIVEAHKAMNISAGQNIFSWGVSVNGQSAVSHSTTNLALMPNPEGQLNLTPLWLNAWYNFDLQE